MASLARKVASPRHLAGAFVSPKVGTPLKVALQHSPGDLRSPLVSSLKKTPTNTLAVHDSPFYQSGARFDDRPTAGPSTSSHRAKSVRRLPWSERGKDSSADVLSFAKPFKAPRTDVLQSRGVSHRYLCVDTPERADMLRKFKQKGNSASVLGKGSFGVVVEAMYKEKIVAVKIATSSAEAIRQMLNETNSQDLHHPNIVSVLKVILPRNDLPGVIIMDRVRGFSLQSILDNNGLRNKTSQRLRYSLHICSALLYCHQKQVLHGDVKPQNVLVEAFSDVCKLCDFGCSLKIGTEHSPMQGSAGYAAPEVLQTGQSSTASDVYSFGITLWQLITGERPYKDMRTHTVIYKVVASGLRPPLPSVFRPEDEAYIALIKNCWSQYPLDRPTIKEVYEELTIESEKFTVGS